MHPPGAFPESAITSKALEKSTKKNTTKYFEREGWRDGVCVGGGGGGGGGK